MRLKVNPQQAVLLVVRIVALLAGEMAVPLHVQVDAKAVAKILADIM